MAEIHQWVDGTQMHLSIESPDGLIFRQTLPMTACLARMDRGELLRFVWEAVDPEDGTVTRGAARLVVEELPDPRKGK